MDIAERVFLVTNRHQHHARWSGYDRITDYLGAPLIVSGPHRTLPQRALSRALRPWVRRAGVQWYHRDSALREAAVAGRWLGRRGRLFHFIYGENSYRYSGHLKRLWPGNALVCTYHAPPERFSQVVREQRPMRDLDALVLLSNRGRDYFCERVGEERVVYIPHGVDTEHFTPGARAARTDGGLRALFVGSHLRDFDCLARAARILRHDAPDARIRVLTKPEHRARFAGLPNVDLLDGISDEGLREEYRQADVLVLTLYDATANNVVLEALACGLPLLATDLIGIRDYVSPACAELVPKGDAEAVADGLVRLDRDRERLQRMREAARLRALEFRWERVAGALEELYRSILSREPLAQPLWRS